MVQRSIMLFVGLICFSYVSYCCDDYNRHNHDEHGDHCNFGCESSISLTDANVNLGRFFVGSTVSLPSPTSEGNQLEFILTGDSHKSFNFSYSMDLDYQMGNGKAEITQWAWEKADYYSNGIYGNAESNRTAPYNNLKLYQPRGVDHCRAYAKFRMTARTLTISANATPGNIQFTIRVVATVNI